MMRLIRLRGRWLSKWQHTVSMASSISSRYGCPGNIRCAMRFAMESTHAVTNTFAETASQSTVWWCTITGTTWYIGKAALSSERFFWEGVALTVCTCAAYAAVSENTRRLVFQGNVSRKWIIKLLWSWLSALLDNTNVLMI